MPFESQKLTTENTSQTVQTSKLKIKMYAEVLGVMKTAPLKKEIGSMHQYDDLAHKDYIFKDEEVGKNLAISEPAAYTYHNNDLNDKEVIGFVPYWELYQYQNIDYSKLSTIAYFSLTSDDTGAWVKGYRENGVWYDDGGYVGFNSARFSNMVAMAHSKNVKVVLVVKNFDPYSIRQIINNTNSAGDRLINNIVTTLRSKSLDGVNVDFEYVPRSGVASDTVTESLRIAFANWHAKLSDRIHAEFPKSHVSTDVFGGSSINYNIYDLTRLGKTSIDQIVMMTYDYITTRCYSGKFMSPMSPLYGNQGYNTSTHLQTGGQQAGSKKIVMGIPYYGIDFQVKTAQKDLFNALVDYPNCDGTIETYKSIVDPKYDVYHNSTTLRWNNTEKARWYVYKIGNTWRHGYYDDPTSLAAKYDFVRSANLGGIAIWVIGYDNNAKELYDVIRDKFQRVPFYVHFGYGVSNIKMNSIISSNGLEIVNSLGNNTFQVQPISQVSGIIMNKLRLYNEVIDVRFEVVGVTRGLNN